MWQHSVVCYFGVAEVCSGLRRNQQPVSPDTIDHSYSRLSAERPVLVTVDRIRG